MKRHLTLRSEHLSELTTNELGSVHAGQQELPTRRCFTGYYPSINAPCPTTDCFEIVTIQSINSPCPTYVAGG